ncbi:MAG: hypothetical protein J5482_03560 [Oscillospiraceae bacterium]|nr:hypothetical protein [Oscillospiraceae bacterium]
MRFAEKVRNALCRLMYGRNGVDQLNLCLIWLMIALNLAGAFTGGAAGAIVSVAGTAVTVWILFRVFSRNLPRRRGENAVFVSRVWYPVSSFVRRMTTRLHDREHRYFTCPDCRTVCRVPRGKGRIVITCPKCRREIRAKS